MTTLEKQQTIKQLEKSVILKKKLAQFCTTQEEIDSNTKSINLLRRTIKRLEK